MMIVPLLVGAATVLQGGMNRWVSERWGLAATVLANNAGIVVLSVFLWLAVRQVPGLFPDFFPDKGAWSDARWWWLIPPVCGLAIVAGIPWAISRLGAFPVMMAIVAAQLLVSMAWDVWVEGLPVSPWRVAGGVLVIAGVALAGMR